MIALFVVRVKERVVAVPPRREPHAVSESVDMGIAVDVVTEP